ncbi:MAG: hypothetical protein R3F42_06660 [Pseudomonadota bacterium]
MALAVTCIASNRNPALFLQDPSFRYRCENLALALQDQGWNSQLTHLRDGTTAQTGQVVVFHRPKASARLAWLLWRLRRRGAVPVADFDDLVFDPELASHSPAVINGILPLRKVRHAFAAHGKALEWFDRVTVSTVPLQEHLQRIYPAQRVTVVPNAVHHSWLRHPIPAAGPAAPRIITYFPGTRSHDHDFQMIVPVLEQLLAEYPQLQLHITGQLQPKMHTARKQLVLHERVPFTDYARFVQRGWLNLAPLQDTPFNHCKSALKAIEAGFWGIPTVCSPIPDMLRFTAAGAAIVPTESAWLETLERVLDPSASRAAAGELRERVLALAHPALMAEAFLTSLD